MTLELDHVFCMVAPDGQAARRLEAAGWLLDEGAVHAGQGTRNRRLFWADCFLELLWVCDEHEAHANPLRLDRRAAWSESGASPVGIGLRGTLSEADAADFWLYDALGPRIWVHRDNERAPRRPLVFVFEVPDDALESRRPSSRVPELLRHRRSGTLRSVRVSAAEPAGLPEYEGPPIEQARGAPHLELVAGDGPALTIGDALSLRG